MPGAWAASTSTVTSGSSASMIVEMGGISAVGDVTASIITNRVRGDTRSRMASAYASAVSTGNGTGTSTNSAPVRSAVTSATLRHAL